MDVVSVGSIVRPLGAEKLVKHACPCMMYVLPSIEFQAMANERSKLPKKFQ
jgi:hypothetical protein